jgi:dihydrolipoamide dehydrogenase
VSKKLDLIVVGGGPGGYVSAIRGAQLGAKVALIHNGDLGGTCLRRGCIPSKALIYCAASAQSCREASALGIENVPPTLRFDKMRDHKTRTVRQLVKGIETLMKSNRISTVDGRGRLTGPGEVTVSVDGQIKGTLTAPRIIWATGSVVWTPPIPGVDGERVITSDHAIDLPGPFDELAIIGAGAVGLEFAYIYSQFNSRVHIFEIQDRIGSTEDPEASEVLADALSRYGCRIHTSARCTQISDTPDGRKRVEYENGGELQDVEVDTVLMAAGRQANTADMGLEEVGVQMDGGRIVVDEDYQTTIEGLYAVGDCIRDAGYAHQAMHEGIRVTEVALGHKQHPSPFAVPSVMFTRPEVAAVGLNEQTATEQGVDYVVGKFPFSALGKAAAMRKRMGYVKLLGDRHSDKLIGASIVGEGASELIAGLVQALRTGATLRDLTATCQVHPTMAEAVGEAALDALSRALHLPPK